MTSLTKSEWPTLTVGTTLTVSCGRRFAARLLLGTGERHEEDDAEQVQADGGNDAKTPAPMIAQFHPPFPAARSSTDLFASR